MIKPFFSFAILVYTHCNVHVGFFGYVVDDQLLPSSDRLTRFSLGERKSGAQNLSSVAS